jgi:hypothetical protein
VSLGADVRSVVRVLLGPLMHLALRVIPAGDPWRRFGPPVPLSLYGTGSQRDFGWYLEGESRVKVESVEEIQDWLLGCEYVDDKELFHEHDFWQHPRTFEHLRRGDCEDHALWAWRKLVELGLDAELVSGRQLSKAGVNEPGSGHVWVVFTRGDETIVFETVAKTKEGMLWPLDEVRSRYRPEVGVNGVRKRFAYHGYLLSLKERRDRGRAMRAAALGLLTFFIACAERSPAEQRDSFAVTAWPVFDSGAIVVRGACPFECCMYGAWQLLTGTTVRAAPGRVADSIAFLANGTQISADSGLVVVHPTGLVVITGPAPQPIQAGAVPFQVGDTLILLNYVGEGMRRVRWRDTVMEVDEYWRIQPSQGARLVRAPVQRWWTHVTAGNVRGWVLMDSVRVKGADKCA